LKKEMLFKLRKCSHSVGLGALTEFSYGPCNASMSLSYGFYRIHPSALAKLVNHVIGLGLRDIPTPLKNKNENKKINMAYLSPDFPKWNPGLAASASSDGTR